MTLSDYIKILDKKIEDALKRPLVVRMEVKKNMIIEVIFYKTLDYSEIT